MKPALRGQSPPEEQPAAEAAEDQLAAKAVQKEPDEPSEAILEAGARSAIDGVRKATQ